jgi:hypothetical protein
MLLLHGICMVRIREICLHRCTLHGLLAYKQNLGGVKEGIVYIITDQSMNRLEYIRENTD